MAKPDRSSFARDNARWLVPLFAVICIWGLFSPNLFALLGGALGLLWVGNAVYRGKR